MSAIHENPNHNLPDTQTAPQGFWQQVSENTGTIVTPSNIIDAIAGVGAVYGIRNIDKPKGVLAVGASFGADAIDGPLARWLGTVSPLGEKIDAVGDKIKLGYGILRLWQHDQADKPLLASVAIQNSANAVITIADRLSDGEPVLHSSKIGKRSFMTQEIGLGLNIAGKALSKNNHPKIGEKLRFGGNIVGFSGVALGSIATAGYFNKWRSAIRKPSD